MSRNEKRNKLTEYSKNFKKCNMNLLSCYTGLHPASLTKLSLTIFNQIIATKQYIDVDSAYYDPIEAKRIYSKTPLTPHVLLQICHPLKYRFEGKATTNDIGNMSKRLKELDDNNIFYIWKCGKPSKNYMFLMERDFGLWKFYNPKAFVTPKTIKKIISLTRGMPSTMSDVLKSEGREMDIEEIRHSYALFVNRMVTKMNPEISKDLTTIDKHDSYRDYLLQLRDQMRLLDDYDGLEEDEHFLERLPLDIAEKLKPKKRKRSVSQKTKDALTPKSEPVKKPRKRTPKKKDPTFQAFKPAKDPLSNAATLYNYYKSLILTNEPQAKFHENRVNLPEALHILDLLASKQDALNFLSSWILFYQETKLKGNNAQNKDRTSLKSFKNTFNEYSKRYIGGF